MVITMSMKRNHDLNFMSGMIALSSYFQVTTDNFVGMVSSWNKLCFTTGYVEISVSMPGNPRAPGLWPAAWTMGNLGRAGYGATTEGALPESPKFHASSERATGLWPYTYDSCDVGTFPFQMDNQNQPESATNTGNGGGQLSKLPGQRLSACTCPDSDHPGPHPNKGRGAPEIDIFETQSWSTYFASSVYMLISRKVDVSQWRGQVSQSAQVAPYNAHYEMTNNNTPATTIYDSSVTKLNTYKGGVYQQASSALTYIDNQNWNTTGYAPYGFEWWSNQGNRDEGYITWFSEGHKTWTMTAGSVGPDSTTQVGQRLISEEPHVRSCDSSSMHTLIRYFPVHHHEPGHVSFLPSSRLHAHAIPCQDVHRLRSGLPERGCQRGRVDLRSKDPPNRELH